MSARWRMIFKLNRFSLFHDDELTTFNKPVELCASDNALATFEWWWHKMNCELIKLPATIALFTCHFTPSRAFSCVQKVIEECSRDAVTYPKIKSAPTHSHRQPPACRWRNHIYASPLKWTELIETININFILKPLSKFKLIISCVAARYLRGCVRRPVLDKCCDCLFSI